MRSSPQATGSTPVFASDERRRVALVLLALVVALSAGCGGQDDADDEAQARFECIQEAQAEASIEVVNEHLVEGDLGSGRLIEREIRQLDSPGFEPVSFLTPQGRVLELDQMTDAQRATFETWKATDRIQNVIQDDEQRAISLAREEAESSCPGGDE